MSTLVLLIVVFTLDYMESSPSRFPYTISHNRRAAAIIVSGRAPQWHGGEPSSSFMNDLPVARRRIQTLLKICTVCGLPRPVDSFYKRYYRKDRSKYYTESRCVTCLKEIFKTWALKKAVVDPTYERNRQRRRRLGYYGMSPADYDAKFAAQGGKCAICRQPETHTYHGAIRNLSVDHDHETGEVRDLLCHYCNALIGLGREDTAILHTAIAYLDRFQRPQVVRRRFGGLA